MRQLDNEEFNNLHALFNADRKIKATRNLTGSDSLRYLVVKYKIIARGILEK